MPSQDLRSRLPQLALGFPNRCPFTTELFLMAHRQRRHEASPHNAHRMNLSSSAPGDRAIEPDVRTHTVRPNSGKWAIDYRNWRLSMPPGVPSKNAGYAGSRSNIVVAGIGLFWTFAWTILATNRPAEHPKLDGVDLSDFETAPAEVPPPSATLGQLLRRPAILVERI